jgi:hypothetical protein
MSLRVVTTAALVAIVAAVLLLTSIGNGSLSALLPGGASPTPSSTSTASGSVVVGAFSTATPISSGFWGVNVEPAQKFGSTDAASVAATSVNYVRFPGGILGEEFNYTSGVVTRLDGTQVKATTTTQEFVTECKKFNCKAIMQLPAEIDKPATAAAYASYVVHTLGYQPAYWEIGNSPSGWIHFGVPWSKWATEGGGNTTPLPFANEVHTYIKAVHAVDLAAKFLALGAGEGGKNYAKAWVEDLASVDGHELSGISVHSYILGGPSNPTDAELFANLQGRYSLPAQLSADQSYIKAACPTCTSLKVFVTEINAAEVSPYNKLLHAFPGTLYLAAEITQGLRLRAVNLDWFCYDCNFTGAWSRAPQQWQMQYYLFSDITTHLKTKTLPTTLTGPSTFYGMATYDGSGLSLLFVNVNTTTAVKVNLDQSGFILGVSGVTQYMWKDGSNLPTKSSVTLSSTLSLPPLSIAVLAVGTAGTISPIQPAVTLAGLSGVAQAESTPGANLAGWMLVTGSVGIGMPLLVLGAPPIGRAGATGVRPRIRDNLSSRRSGTPGEPVAPETPGSPAGPVCRRGNGPF